MGVVAGIDTEIDPRPLGTSFFRALSGHACQTSWVSAAGLRASKSPPTELGAGDPSQSDVLQ